LTAPQSLDVYMSHFLPTARYRFGNNPLIEGSNHIREAAEHFRSRLRGVHHDIKAIWEQEDMVICQMEVTYTRLDGQSLQLPCCNIYGMVDERIAELRVYIDASPIFA
jgi:4-carboxymuconolactone decarboxylase